MGSFAVSSAARISQKPAPGYLLAFLAAALALLGRWALSPVLGDALPYVTLFPAVVFASWLCGVGPSAMVVLLGIFGARYWFIAPQNSLRVPNLADSVGLLVFAAGSALIIVIGELVRSNTAALQAAQGQLEEKVQQRTVELDAANHSLSELSARLLRLQDEERRRIARELHDSVGQTLAALSMNLAAVGSELERLTKTAGLVADSATLVNDMSTDIRTISYLLHPPLLDEAGLCSALTWYVKGFSERSKIEIDLDIPEDFGRLPRDLETAVFRIVQECLTNIHRHADSPVARVRVAQRDGYIRVEVQDHGKGIPAQERAEIVSSVNGTPGVGIRGMRERLRQLGGTLELHSDEEGKGTLIAARLPIHTAALIPQSQDSKSATANA
jgi:signal transduction histidine kinase